MCLSKYRKKRRLQIYLNSNQKLEVGFVLSILANFAKHICKRLALLRINFNLLVDNH